MIILPLDGSDFTAESFDLVFMPGDDTILCTNISITNDEIHEPSIEEMFDIVIELPSSGLNVELGQIPMSNVTILDDDSKIIVSTTSLDVATI